MIGGGVGRVGSVGGGARLVPAAPATPDFTLSASAVTTAWGEVVVGSLTPINAPADVSFVLVAETAGFAVINGGAE